MPRSKPTYLYAIISVALVLFILGFFALVASHAQRLVTLFKEKVDIWIELQENVPQDRIAQLVQEVRRQAFVKAETVTFITREQAQASMKKELGDESLLEDMPNLLHDVIRFNVKADFLQNDSLYAWRSALRSDTAAISELYFEAANTGNVGNNIQNMAWIVLGLGILLIFAAVTLIHNTIRLALFANRFLIKNQELVGASWSFISRPFIRQGILNGLWSALIAISGLMGVQWAAQRIMPDLAQLQDVNLDLRIYVLLILGGILISGLSTYLVVHKFLRMRIDDLY
ncbi:MAG: permease-like cell division protein FtsX [Bacteroidetes bacterium]|nr:permease-like cell division protein FtsX [Bacteroidota bacterium]